MTKPGHGSVILLDNGADTIKIGRVEDSSPRVHVNGLAQVRWDAPTGAPVTADLAGAAPGRGAVCGAALDQLSPLGLQVRRPIDRGLVTDLALQAQIWSGVLAQEKLSLTDERLVLTVPPLCPQPVIERLLKTAFYYFGVKAVHVTTAAYAALWCHEALLTDSGATTPTMVPLNGTGIVVDTGHSFSHVVPIINRVPLNYAVRRLDIGGRLLSNYLKELISYRSWNVMKESYLVHRLKERVCYVCMDLIRELRESQQHPESTRLRYLLPDETDVGDARWGRLLSPVGPTSQTAATDDHGTEASSESPASSQSVLTLTNEHFLVPESLFAPQDTIQARHCGIAELVFQSLERIPRALWPPLLQHVVLVGGNVRMKGFGERFLRELRAQMPIFTPVRVWIGRHEVGEARFELDDDVSDPVSAGWFGLRALTQRANTDVDNQFWLTREMFERKGISAIERHWIHIG